MRFCGAGMGQLDTEALQMAGRKNAHCPMCGAFVSPDFGCRRCAAPPETAGGLAYRQVEDGDLSPEQYRDTYGEDPLFDAKIAGVYSRYATNISGKPRQVTLSTQEPTASTDLRGKIVVNPAPLPADRPIKAQMATTLGMLEHEILHEKYTPLWALEEIVAAGRELDGPSGGEGASLGPKGRMYHTLANILEDARIERIAQAREAPIWQRIWAMHEQLPKDGGNAAPDILQELDPAHQVIVTMLCDAQPGYAVSPQMWSALSRSAQQALREILPLSQRAVTGSARDLVEGVRAIWEVLDRHGVVPASLPELGWNPSAPGAWDADGEAAAGGRPDRSGAAAPTLQADGSSSKGRHCPDCGGFVTADGACSQCSDGADASEETARGGSAQAQDPVAGARGGTQGDAASRRSDGDPDVVPQFLDDEPDRAAAVRALAEAQRFAGSLFEAAQRIKTTEREKRFGRALQRRLKARTQVGAAVEIAGERVWITAEVDPCDEISEAEAHYRQNAAFWAGHASGPPAQPEASDVSHALRVGHALGRRLAGLKTQAQAAKRLQKSGRLDRSRLVAGMKGSERIRIRPGIRSGTSIAASILVDVSGSMEDHRQRLFQAALVNAVAMETADIPYECLTFGGRQNIRQVVAFEEGPRGGALVQRVHDHVAWGIHGTTPTHSAVVSSTLALCSRDEIHRTMIVLTDGAPDDADATSAALRDARARGVETLGVVYDPELAGEALEDDEADGVFGSGNWLRIQDLESYPRAVEGLLSDIIRRSARRGRSNDSIH